MKTIKHYWECVECGYNINFKQPELPLEDPNSEFHFDEKICPMCNAEMYYEEELPTDFKPLRLEKVKKPEKKIQLVELEEDIDEEIFNNFYGAHTHLCECRICKKRKAKLEV